LDGPPGEEAEGEEYRELGDLEPRGGHRHG
jgi:hypothetical protein